MHSSQKLLLKKQKVLNSKRRERSGVYVSFLKDSPKIGKVFPWKLWFYESDDLRVGREVLIGNYNVDF